MPKTLDPALLEALTDGALDDLEHLLLGGVTRLAPLSPEMEALREIAALCPGSDPIPTRVADAHGWVLARQRRIFPRRR